LVGLQRSGAKYKTEPERKAAIAMAIAEAGPGDIVLITGKGHEKVQVSRQGSVPFDDAEVARQLLREAGYRCEEAKAAGGKI
jgi:UDP-N-acetylmuramoyl-L-alanyl-D-glutamate--2,6-diaminopimelate ligase